VFSPERESFKFESATTLYFKFFLSQLPKAFPYVSFFPWVAGALFADCNIYPVLQQSVMAVASLLEDRKAESSVLKSSRHYQQALQMLRDDVLYDLDGGKLLTFYVLSFLNLVAGEVESARGHLREMLLLVNRRDSDIGGQGISHQPSQFTPLETLAWRMAIRIDIMSSISCGKAAILPRFSLYNLF
jgi:hypothetical protein